MNSLFTIADQGLVSGSRLLIAVLVARALGVEEYGTYALLWTLVTFAAGVQVPVAITPMMHLGVKIKLARGSESLASAALNVQKYYSIALTPVVVIASLMFLNGRADVWYSTASVLFYIIAFNRLEYFRRYLIAQAKSLQVLLIDSAVYVPSLTVVYWLSVSGAAGISIYLLAPGVFALLFSLFASKGYPSSDRLLHNRARVRAILRRAKPLLVGALSAFGASHVFIYATAYFLGEAAVGGVSAIRNVIGPMAMLIIAVENITIRGATLAFRGGDIASRRYIFRLSLFWSAIFLLIALALIIAPWQIVSLIYGEEFAAYAVYLQALALLPMFQLWNRIYAMGLVAREQYDTVQRSNMWSLYVSLATVLPLIYFLEIWGLVIGFFVQQVVLLFVQVGLPKGLISRSGACKLDGKLPG